MSTEDAEGGAIQAIDFRDILPILADSHFALACA